MTFLSKQVKYDAFREALGKKSWYAACETDHAFWAGETRTSYARAVSDKTTHDADEHDGSDTAVVLPV